VSQTGEKFDADVVVLKYAEADALDIIWHRLNPLRELQPGTQVLI
jgi:hypothetical protein